MKPDRREGFMDGDGRVHPLDRRRRASASRRLACGWPERSGGIRRADKRDASRHAYLCIDGHLPTYTANQEFRWTLFHLLPFFDVLDGHLSI